MDIRPWNPIPEKAAFEPKFKVICPTCFMNQYLDGTLDKKNPPIMKIRFSALTKLPDVGPSAFACNMYYKCLHCSQILPYGPPISGAEYDDIFERRAGHNYTPTDLWENDEEIQKKKQLSGLGYI